MRYSKSLYYNQIIDAHDANYSDYSRLQLRCISCGEPVHLVGSHDRKEHQRTTKKGQLVTVRQSKVIASFAHFKDKHSEECENFVARKVDKRYIDQVNFEAKNQRLEIYNKHFLELIQPLKEWKQDADYTFKFLKSLRPNFNNRYIKKMLVELSKSFSVDIESFDINNINSFLGYFDKVDMDFSANPFFVDKYNSFLEMAKDSTFPNRIEYEVIFLEKFIHPLQLDVCQEIIHYLHTKAGKLIHQNLFCLCIRLVEKKDLFNWLKNSSNDDLLIKYKNVLYLALCEIILLNDWYAKIEAFSDKLNR